MVLHVLRALFILLMAAVGWFYLQQPSQFLGAYTWLAMAGSLAIGLFFVILDIVSARSKVALLSGTFFGLMVGIAVAYALSFVIRLLIQQWHGEGLNGKALDAFVARQDALRQFITMMVGVVTCYLSISFVLQTKDDFRFVIPYVEFRKQAKGMRPIVLDTSALIDGRIEAIAATGVFDSQLVVPRFVLEELQAVADSGDKLKRNRGRRGLEVLTRLREADHTETIIYEGHFRDEATISGVDEKLLALTKELNGRVLTNDYNLNKVAQLREVEVININDLSNALRPIVLPGEKLTVRLIKPGEGAGQGVGYMPDGTMVVVEQGRSRLNEEVELVVTSALQTSAGRMIFGRPVDGAAPGAGGAVASAGSSSRRAVGKEGAPPSELRAN